VDCDAILQDLNNKTKEVDDTLKDLEDTKATVDELNQNIDWCLDTAYDWYKLGLEEKAEYYMDRAAKYAQELYDRDEFYQDYYGKIREMSEKLERLEEQMHHLEEEYCKCKEENP